MIKTLLVFGFLLSSSVAFAQILIIPRSIPDKLIIPDNLPNPGIDLKIPFDCTVPVPGLKGEALKLGKIIDKPNLDFSQGFSSRMRILDLSRGFTSNMPVKEFPRDFPSNMPVFGIAPPAPEIVLPRSNK